MSFVVYAAVEDCIRKRCQIYREKDCLLLDKIAFAHYTCLLLSLKYLQHSEIEGGKERGRGLERECEFESVEWNIRIIVEILEDHSNIISVSHANYSRFKRIRIVPFLNNIWIPSKFTHFGHSLSISFLSHFY